MTLYNLIAGLVLCGGGSYAFLTATGRIEINPRDPAKSKQWRAKNRWLKWGGPAIVAFGILYLIGVL